MVLLGTVVGSASNLLMESKGLILSWGEYDGARWGAAKNFKSRAA